MKMLCDETATCGVSVFTNDGGILSICPVEEEGEAPRLIVGLQRHGEAMSAQVGIVDAAVLSRALDAMVARHLPIPG